jgi:hypothetical protein
MLLKTMKSLQMPMAFQSLSPALRRCVHTKSISTVSTSSPISAPMNHIVKKMPKLPPLSVLPTSHILRSYLITRATSSPLLLKSSLVLLERMLRPNARILSVDRNPFLNWIFRHTFYAQFCAGENRQEVGRMLADFRKNGYAGTVLEYALEVLEESATDAQKTLENIQIWEDGMLQSISMVSAGDFVALKWSGMGSEALSYLGAGKSPSPDMLKAMTAVCDAAAEKGVSLLPAAELDCTNAAFHAWNIELQKKYNKERPVIYSTYQCYLRSAAQTLSEHLEIARKAGFVLGVKLVRGAYLVSEKPGKTCSSKQETDDAYDAMTEATLRQHYNSVLTSFSKDKDVKFPKAALVIASHNAVSIQKAQAIRSEQAKAGQPRIECTYAQLQGMADDISCELIMKAKEAETEEVADVPRAMKYTTWGTVSQCLHYLYRRAAENQDAITRTVDTRKAMAKELMRRVGL